MKTAHYERGDFELVTYMVQAVNHVATGTQIREARMARGISLRQMAIRMGISAVFLSDLERGRRNWTEKRINQWWKAFSATKTERNQ